MTAAYDLAVIGGGINGCGIARDASGRGLKVFLCEQGDLAGATSSASTKLIHGGLRYLEYYEFRLVREALIEREVLLRAAPHIIRPLRFVLPRRAGMRPAWLIRLGLFLYDHLGGREILPGTRSVDLRRDEAGKPLKPDLTAAFEYSDCWVEDARLVALNAVDAAERGAVIRTGTRFLGARRKPGGWQIELEDVATGSKAEIEAKALVNAAGPWVGEVLVKRLGLGTTAKVRLVKGSHIVVRKLFDHERAYIFQNDDGRIIFAIPYERDFTLIGTTDVDEHGDPAHVAISRTETEYLCASANRYFARSIAPADVVYSYSGVRPLYDDGASEAKAATRDYVLELDAPEGQAPVLNVFGGKITTYRRLAESALAKLGSHFPGMTAPWTAKAPLPGGEFPVGGVDRIAEALRAGLPFIAPDHARRLARAYGTRAQRILEGVHRPEDLGPHFGADLYEREVIYLVRQEWARSARDVLWRRSKLGLHVGSEDIKALESWFEQKRGELRAPAA
ncbi:MAG TPA: glycerol-3-phosphate dehydrogenase [Hypericibacter adhaerens]|jgi:glycerol-3-phosphate dehydrogenase|uniref:Glycerol-3-phosphate dehydrogenase n=1 Tax=Hypericibacter adhaerens TaxID=2602016 RepID=A0A5J6N379_9PROT|nr:glycerol-3-phosphate dehydrogenase [Hypericibacter adhaerens]QEX24221.1 glycerol-3-phosphate dehydrogenase [Hypericibacter adhaerens]HWA42823.1 glycerol-3-phosphate dehydrogenase [Hypericibacter adhaerens]